MGIFISRKNILRCPQCGETYFRDRGFTRCIDDNCELITEDEYQSHGYQADKPVVECPYCKSTDTKKISGVSHMASVGFFGVSSKKIGKQWHCNKCNSDF